MNPARQIAMATASVLAALVIGHGPTAARSLSSQVLTIAQSDDPAQFYVLSFTDQPIVDVAEEVIGGALSQSASVDPAIDGVMSFQAEGQFTSAALLAEFGEALMDRDVALVRSAQGDLALVLRANLATELARGAVLVAASAPARPGAQAQIVTAPAPPIVYGGDRWQDGPLGALLLFLAGALTGAGALRAGQIVRSRHAAKATSTLLMITHDPHPTEPMAGEDRELTIPTFRPSNRS